MSYWGVGGKYDNDAVSGAGTYPRYSLAFAEAGTADDTVAAQDVVWGFIGPTTVSGTDGKFTFGIMNGVLPTTASDLDISNFSAGVVVKTDRVTVKPGIVFDPQSSAPASVEGHVYYDDTANELKVHNGTGFVSVGGTGVDPHQLDSATYHTVSGLTAGHFLKALTPTTFGFAAHGLTYSDVGAAAALSGTQYTIPIWATTTTLGNSLITQDSGATTVTIGGITTVGTINIGEFNTDSTSVDNSCVAAACTNTYGGDDTTNGDCTITGSGNKYFWLDNMMPPLTLADGTFYIEEFYFDYYTSGNTGYFDNILIQQQTAYQSWSNVFTEDTGSNPGFGTSTNGTYSKTGITFTCTPGARYRLKINVVNSFAKTMTVFGFRIKGKYV